jgi:hypothetical protein
MKKENRNRKPKELNKFLTASPQTPHPKHIFMAEHVFRTALKEPHMNNPR